MGDKVQVKVGQVWKDNDKRMHERYLKVMRIDFDHEYAYCKQININNPREVRILIRRMKPTSTGYVYVRG